MIKKYKLYDFVMVSVVIVMLSACQDRDKRYQTIGIVDVRPFYVSSPQGGELKRLYVNEGQTVRKSQIIAKVNGQKVLKAPKSGRVMETFYLQKEYVSPGTAIASLLIPEQVHVLFYIPENDLDRIQVDKVIILRYRAQDYQARINFISSKAEYTPDSLYQDDKRYKSVFKVKTNLPKQLQDLIKVGQSVDVIYE